MSGEKSTVTIEPEWAYGRKGKPEVSCDISVRLSAAFVLLNMRVSGGYRAQRYADLRHGAGGHSLKAVCWIAGALARRAHIMLHSARSFTLQD